MKRKYPENYILYDTSYGNEIPSEQVFLSRFDSLPSKHVENQHYDSSIMNYFIEQGFVEDVRIITNIRKFDTSSQSLFTNEKRQLMVRINSTTNSFNNTLVMLEFTYSITNGEISNQLDFEKIKTFARAKKKSNIKLVKSDHGHLDTEDYDLPIPPMNLELNYGGDFIEIHNVILNALNKNYGKGIILLHGDPGTGKTSYIKYLTSLVQEKDILFIPPSMAEMLSEPSIIPFLMEHKNSILIIEDAERVISDREGKGSPAGVSNILNLTDGILGDCLSIQIVATFNMKRERIDQALLRKGRLIAEHKFEKLSVEETNKLLTYLNKEQKAEEGMVLADIYNIDSNVIKVNKKYNKIGF